MKELEAIVDKQVQQLQNTLNEVAGKAKEEQKNVFHDHAKKLDSVPTILRDVALDKVRDIYNILITIQTSLTNLISRINFLNICFMAH